MFSLSFKTLIGKSIFLSPLNRNDYKYSIWGGRVSFVVQNRKPPTLLGKRAAIHNGNWLNFRPKNIVNTLALLETYTNLEFCLFRFLFCYWRDLPRVNFYFCPNI